LHKARLRALRNCSYKAIIELFREYGVNATTGEPVTAGETDLSSLHKAYGSLKQELRGQFFEVLDEKPDATLELAFRELRAKGDTEVCEKIKRLILIPESETEAAVTVRKEIEVDKQGFLRVWQTLLKQFLALRGSGLQDREAIKVMRGETGVLASTNAINKQINDLHRLHILELAQLHPEAVGGLQELAHKEYTAFQSKCLEVGRVTSFELQDIAGECFSEPLSSSRVFEVYRSLLIVKERLSSDGKTRLYAAIRTRNLQDFCLENGIKITDSLIHYLNELASTVSREQMDKALKTTQLYKRKAVATD
jgi:hypothetical protein